MNPLVDTIKNLGSTRLAMMGAVSIGLLIFFIFTATRLWTPNLSLLYGDLDPSEATQIVNELQSLSITGELSAGGTQVLVPADKVGNARMAMAERGLPAGGNIGYELFNKEQGIGTSNFVQNVNNLRAMEGELGRSISTIATVKSARVHLVLPRRELFSRQQQDPSASIILKMRGVARLDRKKVAAVQHLVAAAVPNLKVSRISIVDDRGTLLARGGEEDNATGISGLTPGELRLSIENRMARKIEQLLEAMVGVGNVRAQVYAQIDPEREVISEERYDPDGQVLRSSQSVVESSQSAEGPPESVSVTTNLPDGAGGGSSTASKSQRTEEANNFEITKSIVNRVKEAGTILGLSVAVAINGTETVGEEGERTYTPRTPEQMQQYERIIRSALGIDDSRGDNVEIVSVRFAGAPTGLEDGDFGSTLLGGFDPSQLQRLIEIIVLAVVSVLVILLVVRPLVAKVLESTPEPATPPGMEGMPPMLTSESGAPLMPGDMAQLGAPGMIGGEGGMVPVTTGAQPEDSLIDIDQVEGRVRASSLRKVGEIIEKHPDEAVSIVRNWMYQEQ